HRPSPTCARIPKFNHRGKHLYELRKSGTSRSMRRDSDVRTETLAPSRQLADGFFQEFPGLLAILALPLRVEAGRAELLAERRSVRLVEGQALAGEVLLQARIELGDIGPLVDGGRVDVLGDDRPDI